MNLPDSVTIGSGQGGMPVVEVQTPRARACLYLHGAHLTEWTPAGQEQVLWLSSTSRFEEGMPIRGGIPLCLPWFSRGPSGDKEPMHGLARLNPWELTGASDSDGTVTLQLALQQDEWSASLTLTIGEELGLELTTTNHGDSNLQVEEALHTYFMVSDVALVSVEGLDGARYFDKVADEHASQEGAITFEGATDRVYESAEPVTILDPGLGRRIQIEKQSSENTVVWNPG
ncbi:MAG: D-hexose-6-phosphate mutarotase, partial [bacterium]|nr:D-hexose-6-phosphate mutarotase [bacterium]